MKIRLLIMPTKLFEAINIGFETMTTKVIRVLSAIAENASICTYNQQNHTLAFNKEALNTFLLEQRTLSGRKDSFTKNLNLYGFRQPKTPHTDTTMMYFTHPLLRLHNVTAEKLTSFLASLSRKGAHEDALKDPLKDPHEDALKDPFEDPLKDPLEDALEDPLKDALKDPLKDALEDPLEDALEDAHDDAHEDAHEGVCTRARKRALQGAFKRARRKRARIAGNVSPLPFDHVTPHNVLRQDLEYLFGGDVATLAANSQT